MLGCIFTTLDFLHLIVWMSFVMLGRIFTTLDFLHHSV